MRTVQLPLLVVVLLIALVAVFGAQGWRMAADRQARLQPARAEVTLALEDGIPEAPVEVSLQARFLSIDLGAAPPPRLGLYEILPARPLVRWVEAAGARGGTLVVPLTGLHPGTYALCAVDPDATAGPREMDLPTPQLDVRLMFVLR